MLTWPIPFPLTHEAKNTCSPHTYTLHCHCDPARRFQLRGCSKSKCQSVPHLLFPLGPLIMSQRQKQDVWLCKRDRTLPHRSVWILIDCLDSIQHCAMEASFGIALQLLRLLGNLESWGKKDKIWKLSVLKFKYFRWFDSFVSYHLCYEYVRAILYIHFLPQLITF